MPDLDEEDGEVVDEDEGRGQAVGKLDDVVVRHAPPLLARHDLGIGIKFKISQTHKLWVLKYKRTLTE